MGYRHFTPFVLYKGAYYCRQICKAEVELRYWGRTAVLEGDAVYEWGTREGTFPFDVT